MVPIWKQTTSNRSLVNGSADRTRLPLRPQLRFRAWAASRADATVAMGQNDSSSALQRVGCLKVEVRDGPRVFKDLVNHDQFGIGRRGSRKTRAPLVENSLRVAPGNWKSRNARTCWMWYRARSVSSSRVVTMM